MQPIVFIAQKSCVDTHAFMVEVSMLLEMNVKLRRGYFDLSHGGGQVDCGGTLLAEITPGACRDMALQEGEDIYCLIKTRSITYLAELDAQPHHRVVSHGDGHYYLGTSG